MLESRQRIDRYQVLRPLGEGGMAKVFLIRDVILDCQFALKVLDPDLRTNDQVRSRFWVEAKIQAQGNHPNIIRVFSTISTAELAGLVMEYVEGPSLEEYIRGCRQRPPVEQIVEIFLPLLSAVRYAHGQEVVHRDIKPSNIILQKTDQGFIPKLGDFGVAKVNELLKLSTGKQSTKGDHPVGTYAYMSPEQIRTPAQIDQRSDLFSLGATLYELSTLRQAFLGDGYVVQEAVVHARYAPLAKFGVDKRLARIIDKSLRVSLAERYQSCDELIADLTDIHESIVRQRQRSSQLGRALLAMCPPLLGLGFAAGYVGHGLLAADAPHSPAPNLAAVSLPPPSPPPRPKPEPAPATPRPDQPRRPLPSPPVAAAPPDLAAAPLPSLVAESRHRPTLVPIPAGSFVMGSAAADEQPQRQVTLTHGFYLSESEVTRAQYKSVMGSALVDDSDWAARTPMSAVEKLVLPVGDLKWTDAIKYCNRLSRLEKLESCYQIDGDQIQWPKQSGCLGYRLPTEAEWEYAAAGGQSTAYPGSASLDKVAWTGSNSALHPHPVKQKQPSAWGLFDLSGNIAEWVWDAYTPYQASATLDPINDERPASVKPCRVLRGGSWVEVNDSRFRLRNRVCFDPGMPASVHGMRVARTIWSSR